MKIKITITNETRNVFKNDKRRRIKKTENKHKAKYLYINLTQMPENLE